MVYTCTSLQQGLKQMATNTDKLQFPERPLKAGYKTSPAPHRASLTHVVVATLFWSRTKLKMITDPGVLLAWLKTLKIINTLASLGLIQISG